MLTAVERERLNDLITARAFAWSVAFVEPAEIDTLNIHRASLEAMRRAVLALSPLPDAVLVDAFRIPNLPIAMHGVASDDDAHVPIILWGRGVRRGAYAGRMNTVDIAPTLSVLLGITPLALVDGHARTEALLPRT